LLLALICCLPSHSDGDSRGSKMHEDLGEYNGCFIYIFVIYLQSLSLPLGLLMEFSVEHTIDLLIHYIFFVSDIFDADVGAANYGC
jgi:hypothetical protein